jgi:hypothetical protein
MASPLAFIYSTADSFKRKLLDVLTDPAGSAQQIVGNANDRAGVLNALTGQLADQTMSSIKAGGSVMPDTPESQQLTQIMADAYNPVGMFIGPASRLWNKDMAFEAQKMLKRGATPQEVWQQTGTVKAPDGQMRQEISDIGSEFQTTKMMRGRAKTLRDQIAENKDRLAASNAYPDLFPTALKAAQKGLRQENKNMRGLVDELQSPERFGQRADVAFKHDRLYEAYPELGNINVRQNINKPGYLGSLSKDGSEMTVTKQSLDLGADQTRSTSLHEFQHGIQELEDFGRGGSLGMVKRIQQEADIKIQDINDQLKKANYDAGDFSKPAEFRDEAAQRYLNLLEERQKMVNLSQMDAFDAYRALTGEAEARLTQTRRNLTDAQRRQYFPFELGDSQKNPYGLDVAPNALLNVNGQGIVDLLK